MDGTPDVEGLQATALDATSVRLQWRPPSDCRTALRYRVRTARTAAPDEAAVVYEGTEPECIVSELAMFTAHRFGEFSRRWKGSEDKRRGRRRQRFETLLSG